jgi:hypothetical protein
MRRVAAALITLTLASGALAAWPHRLAVVGVSANVQTPAVNDRVDLSGRWRFQLDPDDRGLMDHWDRRRLEQEIALPGVLQAQGFGEDVTIDTRWTGQIVDRAFYTAPEYAEYRKPGHIKVPFWLQPDKYYVGPAWYQREIEIPANWHGRRVVLTLERPHWQTTVWLDDRIVGSNDGLSTAHEYDLGTTRTPGTHRLTIRVDNRVIVDVGINSHSITDHTQGNWNGIVGRIELSRTSPVWIDDLQVFPDVAAKSVRVAGTLGNAGGQAGRGTITLAAEPIATASGSRAPSTVPPREVAVTWDATGGTFETQYPLGADAAAWDEFVPARYRLTATLDAPEATKSVTFGMRQIGTDGTQFVLNGRKIFIRGTLECAIFPRTGHPPTDVESWRRIIHVAKAHGLNLFRFHSWCPPEAAFEAADELGFYYQVEVASWANQSTRLGVGFPVDAWLYREADRILRAYGNHPSFLLMPYGNEPAGRDREYLAAWVAQYKARDARRLYTSGSGWPQIAENQFHVTPDPRMQAWGAGLTSRINAKPPETRTDYRDYIQQRRVPIISHEIGQWCAFPNLDEMSKYTGYLKPKNFEIFRDRLREHHLDQQAHDFLIASGKLQTLCYKEEIESALRTPGMGGFELLDLHDFPGQGTALVGVLDPFWESKGYVTPEAYRRFCNTTVPLARLSRRVFTTQDTLDAEIEVAHFGPAPLSHAIARWKLVGDDGRAVAQGSWPARDIPIGNGFALGTVRDDLANVPAPRRYKLVVRIEALTPFENDWDVWVYPARVSTRVPPHLTIATDLTPDVLSTLEAGGRVLLVIPPDRVNGDPQRPIALGFSSIFWNTAWTHGQAPHTLGILCDPAHPAFTAFPTDGHSNWQWWYLIHRARAMVVDGLPASLRPIVQVIDDWFTSRRLALLFEAKVGRGRLIVSSIDLRDGPDLDSVTRQMRHSLLAYMQTAAFNPREEVTIDQVRDLMTDVEPVSNRRGSRLP